MTPDSEENRLDESLRSKFEQFAPPPSGRVWPGIAPHIGPPPPLRRRWRPLPLPLLFGLTALLAGLAGWLLPHGAARRATSVAVGRVSRAGKPGTAKMTLEKVNRNSHLANLNSETPNRNTRMPNLSPGMVNRNTGMANRSSGMASRKTGTRNLRLLLAIQDTETLRRNSHLQHLPAENTTDAPAALAAAEASQPLANTAPGSLTSPAADATPVTLRPLVALERRTLVQLPGIATLAAGPLDAAGRTAFIGTLRTERAELLRLQRRTDSLLLALGDRPGAAAPAGPAVAAAPAADSARPRALRHRWSLLLTAAPEQNTLTLQGPEDNPLTALRRNHETGRAGLSAALLAEYRLARRLSVAGGVGFSTFGADLRITNKTTDVSVTYSTATTHATNVYTSVNQTHSIRIVQVPQLSPIFNGSGQVIRYDTVYVPRPDTVFTTIVQHDTVRTTTHTTTPLISKKETLSTKLLQPNYRFFTVPVLLRYRLSLGPGRWWADVAGGAQLQFFLGGTQVVTADGENFRTEAVTAGTGPFRALNVALSGSLGLNYALSRHLSVSVAPSMRWQALSLYKPETGLVQQPLATGLLFGVRLGL